MRKLLLLLVSMGALPLSVCAGEFLGSASYTGSSEFNKVSANATWRFGLNWQAGLEGKFANEDIFKDPVYTLKLPIGFSSNSFSAYVEPFYYFKNKSDKDHPYQAFGVSGQLVMTLEDDSVNDLYSHAYIGAAFARQQGTRTFDTGNQVHNYYSQAAYTLGLHKNFYRAFSFEAAGAAFQYPDGITGITAFRGILDQQDLVSMQTYEIVHELPKYTAGTRLTWLWPDRHATLYVGYRFGEFYSADPEHSAILGNTFALSNSVLCEMAYNHLRTVHNRNKRDIFYVQLKFKF